MYAWSKSGRLKFCESVCNGFAVYFRVVVNGCKNNWKERTAKHLRSLFGICGRSAIHTASRFISAKLFFQKSSLHFYFLRNYYIRSIYSRFDTHSTKKNMDL